MTKKKSKTKTNNNIVPFVSVCTPTFNRRPFIQTMFECFKNQDYPKNRIEWIIVDDGTDKIKDLIETSNIPQIRYFELDNKLSLGAKRNFMHKHVKGSIIVYMDDDDYYPPERISHSVDMLQKDDKVLCAGSSEIYVYYKTMNKMMQCGPYGPNHATAGTFAFKTKLLEQTKYEDEAALAEERAFLKEYTIPFVQLDPLKTILVFSHDHNTFDKREMFNTSHPDYFKESDKTVDSFIRRSTEESIKNFFIKDIDELLKNYSPGLPNMKPDVLTQMAKIKKERAAMVQEELEKRQNGPIILQQGEGKPNIELNSLQVVDIIKQLQTNNQQLFKDNQMLHQRTQQIIKEYQEIQQLNKHLQMTLITMEKTLNETQKKLEESDTNYLELVNSQKS